MPGFAASLFRYAVAAALLGLVGSPTRAQAQQLQDIVIALPAYSLSFSFEFIAEDIGLYEKHGLRVKSIVLPGVGAINGVISGSTEFGVSSSISLTRAAAHGQKLLAIAETTDHAIVQIVLRKDLVPGFDATAPLEKRALLLRGKTIAVDAINSLIHAYVRMLAKRAGFSQDDIHVAVMQPPNMEAALEAKQIDGFAMSPPWPEKPVLEGTAVMIASGPDGEPADLLPFANNVILTRPETCEKRRALCEGVGQAASEAVRYVKDNPVETLAILKKHFPTLDDKLLAASFDVIRKITPVPPTMTREGIENADILNIDAGLMQPDEKLKSYDDLFTNKYVH